MCTQRQEIFTQHFPFWKNFPLKTYVREPVAKKGIILISHSPFETEIFQNLAQFVILEYSNYTIISRLDLCLN